MVRKFTAGTIIGILLLTCGNCINKSSTTATQEFKIGLSQEFENLNPVIISMAASSYMYAMVGRTLSILNSNGQWLPQLAQSIPTLENGGAQFVTENGIKKIKAVWEIKEGAKWGDGTPLICEDFIFSLKVVNSPFVSTPDKGTYTQVENIEADPVNPKKCTFTFDRVRWDFNRLGALRPLPKHLEEGIFKQFGGHKEGYEKNSNYVKNPTHPGLYCGPYVVSELKLGSHAIFTPNPYFYGNTPHIQKIIVKVIPDTGALETSLRSGQIDAISSLGITFDQAIAFDKISRAEKLPYSVIFQPGVFYEHIALNLDNPILKDVRVRKALVLSINREDLSTALFDNRQKPADHFISPIDISWYTKDPQFVVSYKYSKEAAIKLLEEAGWKLGPNNFRFKGSEKLTLSLVTTDENKTRELVQQYLKDQWKQIGIDVQVKNESSLIFFGEITKKRKFPALAMYAWISSPEAAPYATFHSQSIPTEKNGWSGQNNVGWRNQKMDALLDELIIEMNPQKRASIIHEMIKLYTDEVPSIPLYYRSDVAVVPTNLKGFKLPGHQFAETNEIENWSFEGSPMR